MHTSTLHHDRKSVRFRFWSRKSYAVFGSLHCHVTIGSVGKGIADSDLDKSKVVFSLRDNCRGVQHLAAEDKDDWEADAGFPQRENGSDFLSLLFAGGGCARGSVYAGWTFRIFVIHVNGVTKQLCGICADTKAGCFVTPFFLYILLW